MDEGLKTMLFSLDEEIERKCFELREKRWERTMKRTFVLLCMLFIVVPVVSVFLGLSVRSFISWAAVFVAVIAAVLSPVILSYRSPDTFQPRQSPCEPNSLSL